MKKERVEKRFVRKDAIVIVVGVLLPTIMPCTAWHEKRFVRIKKKRIGVWGK